MTFLWCMLLSLVLVIAGKMFGIPLAALFVFGCLAIVSIKYLRSA
jgi:hypothetical protein